MNPAHFKHFGFFRRISTGWFVIFLLVVSIWQSSAASGGTVVVWDDNSIVQANVPAGLSNVVSLAADTYYTIAIKDDGTVAVWGQFYDDVITLPNGLTNIIAAAAGPNDTLAIKADGTAIAWGDRYNSFGVQNVPAGLTNAVAAAATVYNSYYLKGDGTIAGGDATVTSLNNVTGIAARDYSGLALKCDGTVVGWGQVNQINLPAGLTNIVAIVETDNNALALKSDGTVISWANDVPLNLSNVIDIAVGGDYQANHNLALKSDGTVVSWGSNPNVPAGLSNVVGIAANYEVSEAIVNDGSPLIFRQPFVSQTVFSGTTVILNVGAAGVPQLSYQWQENNTNVPGSTNATLILQNVHTNDGGIYDVVVTNSMGMLTSRSAALTVIDSPPTMLTQPLSQTCGTGAMTTFSATAAGSLPFIYQWRINGTNISWATNMTLTVTNLQLTNAGSYDVLVGNAFGTVDSSNAVLTILDFAAALNTTNLIWQSSGDIPWSISTTTSEDGVASAQSGAVVGPQQQSILQTTAIGPGTVTFWWFLYEQSYPLILTFTVNGVVQAQMTASAGGQVPPPCYLGAGLQTLKWIYTNGYSGTSWNSGFLDQVSFTPGGTAPIIAVSTGNQIQPAGTNVTFTVSAVGTPPLYYQWFLNSNSIAGATNSMFILTNVQTGDAGIYNAQVSNDFGVSNSSNATLTINASAPFIITQPTNQWALPQGSAYLSVVARGSSPLNYQWRINGTNIQDATNSTLSLSNVQSSDGGIYAVTVGNANGTITSSNALLTVSSVVGWDSNNSGQATVPYNLGAATAIGGSQYDSVAVKIDSTVAAWGLNDLGETNVPANLTNVLAVAASQELSLALKNDGTVAWWGWSSYTNSIPTMSNITALAASQGNFYSAIQSNGLVVAWGANGYGQTNVPAALSNVVAIAVGDYHCLALRNDGTVVGWGGNVKGTYGQATVPAGLSNVVAVAAGDYYSLALRNDGSVVGFPTNNANVVMRIPSSLSNVVSIAAAYEHALALTSDGKVWEWGTVGTGYLSNKMGYSNVVAIACGYYHSLANIGNGSPSVIRQPWSQRFYAGYSTMMDVGAVGVPPLSFQWQLNGTNINGATNTLLTFANVQPANAGNYSLVVSNSFGMTVSSNATLTVVAVPPTIILQPTNQTVFVGSNTTFTAAVGPGPVPTTCQWQINGTNISSATNTALTLTSVQITNQGSYVFVASNSFGSVTSSNATLTVTGYPPSAVSIQPAYQTGVVGSNCSFTVTAGGSPPFGYQWQFNGTNISLATNATLTLANLQFTNQGSYGVVVTNYFGSATSSNATLVMVTALDLPTALNPGLIWTNGGNTNWFAETSVSLDGEAAQSGLVGAGQKSTLQTTVTGPGTLSFWWMFTPVYIPSLNSLTFSTSQSNNTASVTSTSGWQQKTFYLGDGQQVLSWSYSRYVFITGQSTGWVDQVSFVPGGTAPIIRVAPNNSSIIMKGNATFAVGVVGTQPFSYQWQFNGANLANQTNATLTLLNCQPANSGIYSVMITNNYGSISTNATLFVQPFVINTNSTNLWMTTNGFQLLMNGVLTTNPVIIFASTDLVNWLPIFTNLATTGSIQFLDVTVTNQPARFYRGQE